MSRVTLQRVTRHNNALPLSDQSPSTEVVYGVVCGVGVAQRHLPRPLTLLSWLPIDNSKRSDIGEATLKRNLNRTGTSLEGRTQELKYVTLRRS